MPAKLPKNPRQGNRAEELGLFLLGTFTAVAPVPRTHDVGLDAVVTLLRSVEGRNYLAEDSFYVQMKAVSVREIPYEGDDEVKWLSALELPLFIGSVDLKRMQFDLYTCHKLSELLVAGRPTSVVCCLDEEAQQDKAEAGVSRVWLGPPILSWVASEREEPAFRDKAYEILKPIIVTERLNAGLRRLGIFQRLKWETNHPPEPHLRTMQTVHSQPIAHVVLRVAIPYLWALAFDSANKREKENYELFQQLFKWVRERGVDPDPTTHCGGLSRWQICVTRIKSPQK